MIRRSLLTCLLAALAAGPAARADVVPGTAIDGPSPDILSVGALALARDGTGAVAYLKRAGGVPHAWAVSVSGHGFATPGQVDGGQAAPSSDVVAAAAQQGRAVVAWINAGTLYAAVRASGTGPFGAPQAIATGAELPAVGMATDGTGYLTYTAPGPGGHDLYVARLDLTSTTFQGYSSPLNLDPGADAASTPATRSRLMVASDGTALVTWAEANRDGHTHVIARKVRGDGISAAPQDLTLPALDGQPGGSADSPFPALRDGADFGWVAFRQSFGGVSRVVARQEEGSAFDVPQEIDSLSFPTADGADDPSVAIDATGNGLSLTELTGSHQVISDVLLDPDFKGTSNLQAEPDAIAPEPVLALGYDNQGAAAWLQSTGPSDPVTVRARAFVGGSFTPEAPTSNPRYGLVDPGAGLAGSADRSGNALVAFVQQAADGRRLVVGGSPQPPAGFGLTSAGAFPTRRPTLRWSASSSPFGVQGYTVVLDRRPIATTTATHLVTPALAPGAHRVSVVATDPFGQTTSTGTRIVRVGAHAPQVTVRLSGSTVHVAVGGARLRSVSVRFGDGSHASGVHSTHRYAHAGRYTVSVTVRPASGPTVTATRRLNVP